jgi:glycosyltransferase involved in cell wall biosynthesis
MVFVSVVLPLNRVDDFTLPAVHSVLDSKGVELELIIIADGLPEEEAQELVKKANDARIVLVFSEGTGIVPALNKGIQAARYDFIARMDGDDICHPERLARQVRYLVRHKEVLVVGCNVDFICQHGKKLGSSSLPGRVAKNALLRPVSSPVAHPAAMIRSSVFRQGVFYREIFSGFQAEDFDLWYQVLNLGLIHNLKGRYLRYRLHPKQVSTIKAKKVALSTIAVVMLDIYKFHEEGRLDMQLRHETPEALLAHLLSPSQISRLPLARRLRANLYFGYLGAFELLQAIRAKILPSTTELVVNPIASYLGIKPPIMWSVILVGPVAILHLQHALRLAVRAVRQCSDCKVIVANFE